MEKHYNQNQNTKVEEKITTYDRVNTTIYKECL